MQNQTSNPNMQMGGPSKKANPLVLIIVTIAVIALIAATYFYMQGFVSDYWPGSTMDYVVGDKMMEGAKTETTDAGPEIMLDKDTTADIQSDVDKTNLEEVDEQFMEIDKDLQAL